LKARYSNRFHLVYGNHAYNKKGALMPIRAASGSLTNLADWSIQFLSDEQLLQAQLPPIVPTKKKPIPKPAHW
jgi:hypothetical protein